MAFISCTATQKERGSVLIGNSRTASLQECAKGGDRERRALEREGGGEEGGIGRGECMTDAKNETAKTRNITVIKTGKNPESAQSKNFHQISAGIAHVSAQSRRTRQLNCRLSSKEPTNLNTSLK